MSFGPAPRQQANWDWRAAGNFICGGAGSGLIVFTALSGAKAAAMTGLLLAGLALHVFLNPRTSWMSREAFVAALLFPVGLTVAAGVSAAIWPVAALALAFAYCQSRLLGAAKGIPTWSEPLFSPVLVLSGLVEGGGLFFLSVGLHRAGTEPLLVVFGVLVLARMLVWLLYRRRIAAVAAPRALFEVDSASYVLQLAGTILPLALIVFATAVAMDGASLSAIVSAAGLLAAISGAWMKYALITRAGFTRGFALRHLPVRGARR